MNISCVWIHQRPRFLWICLSQWKKVLRFVTSAKHLGAVLENEFSFKAPITNIVKACFCTIRKLSKIKSFLSYEHLRTLVSTFSKIDYCNSLYYGINVRLLNQLQAVQNSAVRLIRKKENYQNLSIDGYLKRFHWLRVKERIIFKVLLLFFLCIFLNPGTMTTHAESINSDLQRGLDRRLRHTQQWTQNRTSKPLKYQRTTNTTATRVVKY